MNTIIKEYRNTNVLSEKIGYAVSLGLFSLVCLTLPLLVVDLITNGAPHSFGLYGS